MSTLGAKVRELRRARGISMERLAAMADVAYSTIRDIEVRGVDPRLSTLRTLKEIFIVSYDELIGDFDSLSPDAIAEAIRLVGMGAANGSPTALAELQRLTEQLNQRAALPPPPASSAKRQGTNGKAHHKR